MRGNRWKKNKEVEKNAIISRFLSFLFYSPPGFDILSLFQAQVKDTRPTTRGEFLIQKVIVFVSLLFHSVWD